MITKLRELFNIKKRFHMSEPIYSNSDPIQSELLTNPDFTKLGVESKIIPDGPGKSEIESVIETFRQTKKFDPKSGPWIAGGAARRLYEGQALGDGDIDIFLSNYDDFKIMKNILDSQKSLYQSSAAYSYKMINTGLKVQIVKRKYYTGMSKIFCDFDFSVSQFVTDGVRVYSTNEAREDVNTRRLRYATNGSVQEIS